MDEKVYGYMDWPRIEAIVYGEETAPRDVMGPRITQDGVLIQGFFPDAEEVSVISGKKTYVCEKEDEAGYFAVLLPVRKVPEYRFLIKMGETEKECYDPYAFPCQITEEEEKAFCAGVYYEAYKKLGAHPMEIKGVKGTLFAVWAPNAVSVNIAGDFNGWIGRATIMHRMPMSGIFELFVPGVEAGTHYKYEIKVNGGEVLLKADPYGNSADHDPEGASVVADVSAFQWNDGDWMKERHRFDDRKQPVSIYETSLEEWKSAEELVEFLAEEDFTHVELHPVMEYLDDITGGYSTYAYYAPTSRFGSVADFQKLVDELHQAGVGVILDWTPAQFPRYASGLEKFDGTPLYERQNPAEAIHPFWGTLLYNYGSPMVKDFLIGTDDQGNKICYQETGRNGQETMFRQTIGLYPGYEEISPEANTITLQLYEVKNDTAHQVSEEKMDKDSSDDIYEESTTYVYDGGESPIDSAIPIGDNFTIQIR